MSGSHDIQQDAGGGSDGDVVVTRSEEELGITTRRVRTRRARLRRFVETETVTRTVEVRRERVRVEYEPVPVGEETEASAGMPGDESGTWMVLCDEEVVVTTRRVPRERVRLRIHSVAEHREVSEVLRRERVEVVGADSRAVPGSPDSPGPLRG